MTNEVEHSVDESFLQCAATRGPMKEMVERAILEVLLGALFYSTKLQFLYPKLL